MTQWLRLHRLSGLVILLSLCTASHISQADTGYVYFGLGASSYDGEESATAVNITAALDVTNWFSAELGFTDFGEVDALPISSDGNTEATLRSNAMTLAAVARYALSDTFSFHAKAGIDLWEADIDATSETSRYADTDEGTEPTLAFGMRYRFSGNWMVTGEYQIHSISLGENDLDVEQLMVGVGLAF